MARFAACLRTPSFAAFYDEIMGDRSAEVERIRTYIKRYHPSARSLLELGCGTGAMLAGLAPDLAVTGVDRSPEMLAIAPRRGLRAQLGQADIAPFALGTNLACVFDVFDHLVH